MTDLISKRAAIDALGKCPEFKIKLFGKSYEEGRSDQWFKDVAALVSVPSEQPERKTGKWIDMGDFVQCSTCTGTRLKEVNTVYGKAIWIKTAYCPNCGAKMKEEKDETD